MSPGADSDFERQLRELELRRPPAEWKALLLPKPVSPWLPKPLLIGLAACWAATAGFLLTTPKNEAFGPPLIRPLGPLPGADFLLGFNAPENPTR